MEFGPEKGASSAKAIQEALGRALEKTGHPDLGKRIANEKKWRDKYTELLVEVQKTMLKDRNECYNIAKAGLEELHQQMHWNGQPLATVEPLPHNFETNVIKGKKQVPEKFVLPIPRESSAKTATSAAPRESNIVRLDDPKRIMAEVERWSKTGLCEPNVVESMKDFLENPVPNDSDVFVCLGAGSEMGSTKSLLKLGATVVAVELPGKDAVWNDLIAFAENTSGTLVYPTRNKQPGADIIKDLPQLMSWLIEVCGEKRMIIASYLYLDGANFVKVSSAADKLSYEVQRNRPGTVLAYLCSPSETFCVPERTVKLAKESWQKSTNLLDLVMMRVPSALHPNEPHHVPESGLYLQDCYTNEQGPNYAIAKLLQRFRTIVTGPSGAIANIAPASLTHSVMHMWVVKVGILGCERFGIVPFLPETSNAIMTALLLQDIKAIDHPTIHQIHEQNPFLVFQQSAVHGGTWTSAFKTSTTTQISVLAHFINQLDNPYVKVGGVALAGYALSRL